MKSRKKRKAGFTLVELMVVAIIVAILAAVAIPLMSGNKRRAVATEGQAGCSTIRTAMRVFFVENGALPTGVPVTSLPGITTNDLNGSYFRDSDYSYTVAGEVITITADAKAANSPAAGTVILTVTNSSGGSGWDGSLLR